MRHSDDAGVVRLTDDIALVQTLDFFTPIVDNPYDFGRIAAANAFSDIYAMGGTPLTAMNIVCFPSKDFSTDILKQTLAGGQTIIQEAEAHLVGGHSVDDQEFKYGLSVTGVVHPDKIVSNSGASPGDLCVLTKPLGTGILATAIKGQIASQQNINHLIQTTSSLNKYASTAMKMFPISACTDITGFGLAGHSTEMALASNVCIHFYGDQLPLIPQATEYAQMGMIPAGAYANKNYFSQYVRVASRIPKALENIFYDPQTSGGLLLSIPAQYAQDCLSAILQKNIDAAIVGEVKKPDISPIVVLK